MPGTRGSSVVSLSGFLSSSAPMPEANSPAAGTGTQASRNDHTHPRLTSTATGTLNSSGEATITFTRVFSAKPAVTIILVESADNQPVIFKVKTWTQNAQNEYTGCVIKGYRSQTIPQNLVSLLLGAVFNLFAGTTTGAEYSLIALQQS